MADFVQLVKRYSAKYDRKIKKICSPLLLDLDIQVFTYYFIEQDGRFGYLSNMPEFNEFYFSEKLHLINPYFGSPGLFRSGHVLCPCALDENTQRSLTKKFNADHLFLTIKAKENRMEGFIFANEHVDMNGGNKYLLQLDLLSKFGHYFKREAQDIIGRMRGEQFNICKERGAEQFNTATGAQLISKDPKSQAFLKKISGLSPQEIRCLELFKQGYSAQATGAVIGISQRTVEHYFESIKNKLECSSKYDLLNY